MDQMGRVYQISDGTLDLMTSKSDKEIDHTKMLWTDQEEDFAYQTPQEKATYHEPGVYLNDSHPDIKEALRAQEEEDEHTNVLKIDFEELFQSTNSAKQESRKQKEGNSMVSRGVQTEDDVLPVICSMCIRCGERTDVKVRLDFGDTPVKCKTNNSITKRPANILASGKVIKPQFSQIKPKLDHSKEKLKSQTDVNRRLLFRNKQTISPQQQKGDTTIFTALKSGPSPSKLNQRTYLKHFESRRNLPENSDMKYFSGALRKMSHHSLAAKNGSNTKSLNKSSSFVNIKSNQKKVVHSRSLGRSREEEPTLDLPVEISLDSLIMDQSLVDHRNGIDKAHEKMPQWPLEVDIDLGDISLVTDQTYVRKRDPRSQIVTKNVRPGPFLKSNWKTPAIN